MIFARKLFLPHLLVVTILAFGILPMVVAASTTDGTIDSTYKYAEGLNANVGKINFGLTAGNVHLTDTLLTGYAWSETSGWINLSPTNGGVTNNAEGVLSGYAWGENTGWINFAPTQGGVTVDTLGVFHGYAWSQNLGWISFNCANNNSCATDDFKVQTDWRPLSTRTTTVTPSPSTTSTGGGSGSTVAGVPVINAPSVQTIAASSITTTSAALNGYLNPNGSTDTVRWFEWGTSPLNLDKQTTHYSHGTLADGFSDTISGLVSDTPYYFRAVAQNSYGTVAGYVLSFTIPGPATVVPIVTPIQPPVVVPPTPPPTTSPIPGSTTLPPSSGTAPGTVSGGTSGAVSGGTTGGGGGGAAPSVFQSAAPILKQVFVLSSTTAAAIQHTINTSVVLTVKIVANAKKHIVNFTNTPVGSVTTKTVTTAGVVGGGAVAVATVAGNAVSLSDFSFMAIRLWSLFLIALGLRKRRVPWGTVYDSVTKQPLDPAYVILADPSEKEAGTAITDLDGRFGFLVPPGSYHLVANKTNYSFPSKKLAGKTNDELYDNLYFGGDLVLGANDVITKNIPMDPEAFDWNEFAKRDKKLMMFYSRNARIFTAVSTILFYVGLVSATVLFLARPDNFNLAIIVLYAVLFILRLFGLKPKSYGTIVDATTKEPLSFAIVRIFQKGSDREMFHRVTDQYGRYYSLLAKGEYYVTIERKNADGTYTPVLTSDTINAKKGIINKNFRIS